MVWEISRFGETLVGIVIVAAFILPISLFLIARHNDRLDGPDFW